MDGETGLQKRGDLPNAKNEGGRKEDLNPGLSPSSLTC